MQNGVSKPNYKQYLGMKADIHNNVFGYYHLIYKITTHHILYE